MSIHFTEVYFGNGGITFKGEEKEIRKLANQILGLPVEENSPQADAGFGVGGKGGNKNVV